jgi:hypothetical protein
MDFFRASSVQQAGEIISRIFRLQDLTLHGISWTRIAGYGLLALGLLLIEYVQRHRDDVVSIGTFSRPLRFGFYYALILFFFFVAEFDRTPFIYFRF